MGVGIILHTFSYGRHSSPELDELCETVFYYKRDKKWYRNIGFLPFIITSRKSSSLISRLESDSYPVLFEGLHTSYYLGHEKLKNKSRFLRAHNIEHQYYYQLFLAEKISQKKIFFLIESIKLRFAERILKKATGILSISKNDHTYYRNKYSLSHLINPFHSNDSVFTNKGKGQFILFHGNLSVPENQLAVHYLVKNIFSKISIPVIIAGKNPSSTLVNLIEKHKNILLIASPGTKEMDILIQDAHANILFTFQQTGIKLKLIESLYRGRYCIVNDLMVKGTGLEAACMIGSTAEEMTAIIEKSWETEFTREMVETRKGQLMDFDNRTNALKLVNILSCQK